MTGLDASVLFFFLRLVGVRGSGPPIFSLFRLCRIFLHSVHVMQQMTLVEMHVKWPVTLTDRLGPDLNCVRNKGTIFASYAFTCKSSWLVVKFKCAPD